MPTTRRITRSRTGSLPRPSSTRSKATSTKSKRSKSGKAKRSRSTKSKRSKSTKSKRSKSTTSRKSSKSTRAKKPSKHLKDMYPHLAETDVFKAAVKKYSK